MNHWSYENGLPLELGATLDIKNKGTNFCLYSKNAKEVKLLLFHTSKPDEVILQFILDPVLNRTNTFWHYFIPNAQLVNCNCYAYRIDGEKSLGNLFNKNKLLLDPWAKAIFFPPNFSRFAAMDNSDNIGKSPLAYLPNSQEKEDLVKVNSNFHTHDLIIYEIHVKGFTQSNTSNLAEELRGTYAGVIEKIPYLKDLGVTAVEIMPIHQFDPSDSNYWGYMTMNFFTPHNLFCTDKTSFDAINEFKQMVNELHKADIEVILDVVYNHTTESGFDGPTYSFKGIDNSSYYLMNSTLTAFNDDAGTGNVMRTSYKMVRKLILDSLRYWVQEMNVDGFRFDLASIFTRNDDGSINFINPPILEEISLDPVLSNIRLIAEPWDVSSYQIGQKFSGALWAQWNGKYRDDIRKFVKGDNDMISSIMTRIYGSSDLFPDFMPFNSKPYQSINFITSHDGFTLYDLVSYNEKHNQNNGHNNTDGTNDNFSWNCGTEGLENISDETLKLRKKQVKNFFTILMFSNGIPMFRMGDEFLQTQFGNNNPYNQDNETSWLNWDLFSQNQEIFQFVKYVIQIRKTHPSICRENFWRQDISWFGNTFEPDLSYFSHTLAFKLNGKSVNDNGFYVIMNMYWEAIEFQLQLNVNENWFKIIDTAQENLNTNKITTNKIVVSPRSIIVLKNNN